MDDLYCLLISGSSGTGKTTTAREIWNSSSGNPAYLSLDTIKHFVQRATSEDYFLDLARETALLLTEKYIDSGHPVIVDKAFGRYEYVKPFVDLAEDKMIPSFYFKLVAPLDVLTRRVEDRKNAPLEEKIRRGEWPIPKGDKSTAKRIYQFFEANQHEEGIEIDTSENSVEEVVSIIQSYLPKDSIL